METGTNCAWEMAMAWEKLDDDDDDDGDNKYTTLKQQAQRFFVPGIYTIK
jgi:hypothetical protein